MGEDGRRLADGSVNLVDTQLERSRGRFPSIGATRSSRVQTELDGRVDERVDERGLPHRRARGHGRETGLGRVPRRRPVTGRQLDVSDPEPQERLVPVVGRLGLGMLQEPGRSWSIAAAGGEDRRGARRPEGADREDRSSQVAFDHGVGFGPTTEPGEGIRAKGCRVGPEARIDATAMGVGDGVAGEIDDLLVLAELQEGDAQVHHRDPPGLTPGRGSDRSTAERDSQRHVAVRGGDETGHPGGHRPRQGIGLGAADDLEQPHTPAFGLLEVTGHDLRLRESREDAGGARVLRSGEGRLGELVLLAALGQLA
jgi:hypothetical protein